MFGSKTMQPTSIALRKYDPTLVEHLVMQCEMRRLDYKVIGNDFVINNPNNEIKSYLHQRLKAFENKREKQNDL